jgi:hypothetical protein
MPSRILHVCSSLAIAVAACLCVAATATAAGPPAATTGEASAITSNSATVAGSVNPNGLSTTYTFQYGTTTGYGLQTDAITLDAGTDPQAVSRALTGLHAGTTYHYRLLATNSAGTTVGADATFATAGSPPPPPPPLPTASTRSATAIGTTRSTLRGGVNPKGAQTTYYFEFGLTPAYGLRSTSQTLAAGTRTRSVRATLTGLQPGTTYHYRLVAVNANGTALGRDHTFTTSPAAAPARVLPRLTSRVKPRRDRHAPYRYRVSGRLVLPAGVTSSSCRGRVTVRFRLHGKTVKLRRARVRSTCAYTTRVRVRIATRGRSRALRVTARFGGNAELRPKSAPARSVRAG